MEDSAGEILYETRLHASGPYTSNYPPIQQGQGGANGGVLSFLTPRGVRQLKEKWSEYRNPKKLKKPISLFVSPSGERVAVAVGNQVTVLSQEDDYQNPCGLFASNAIGSFTHGAWSEPHGVLGLLDDNDVIYFVKENGEEISRAAKQDLKLSSPVIGLMAQGATDVRSSLLCSFVVLTSDGVLYCAEISQQPSASISSGCIRDVRRQFPRNVFCFDYSQELSLLVVIGSSNSSPVTSIGTSGPCYISLWRRRDDLVLDPLCSTQFEGIYRKQKDYTAQLAYPKVLVSPGGNYIAAIDMNGHLSVFKWDERSCSLVDISHEDRLDSQVTDTLLNERTEIFSEVVEFTWWCDHVLVLVKQNGPVIMFDIVSGLKQIETERTQSISCIERVQKTRGHLFFLENLSSAKKFGSSDSNNRKGDHDSLQVEQTSEEGSTASEFSRLHWRLMSFSEKSVSEMYKILINTCKYEAALDLANCHQLDRDEVLKSQWLNSERGIYEITTFLSNIKDHSFVLSQCVEEVGPTEAAAKALLSNGLQLTNQYRFDGTEDHESGEIWDFRMSRLRLLQFSDKLETFLGINMGRFSVQDYRKFRITPVNEAAVTLAESGKIGALNLLFKRHPYSLSSFMLEILAAIPETIPVQSYVQLLPGRYPPTNIAMREEDWVECDGMVRFIKKLPENHEIASHIRTEPIIRRSLGSIWPSMDDLSAWYKHRARDIDSYSGLLENCLCLVNVACEKGIYQLQQFLDDISYLHQLVYSDNVEAEMSIGMSLLAWEKLSDYEKFKATLKGCKEEDIVEQLHSKAVPFMRKKMHDSIPGQEQAVNGHFPGGHEKDGSFLVRWLEEVASENKLDLCLIVFEEGCKEVESCGFFRNATEAVDCALQCIYHCTSTDRWGTMAAILSNLPHNRDAEIAVGDLEQRCKVSEGHVEAGRLLAFYQVPKPISFFLGAHLDEKGVKQILRLVLSKFMRRQPGQSDNDWANMWRDIQCLQEKAFPFLDLEYMLTEFCRGLLKAGKFSLARNYLKGTGSVALSTEKAENLVIQAAREYFYSASSLNSSEIWKAKECLNIFPCSRHIKAEADLIDVVTVKLPKLGVTLLPMQFRQIKDPMEIIKMAITQTGAYLHVEELIEVAKLLGLNSSEETSAVQEAIAREAAVAGDLQLAFDLCVALARKGHGLVWDLCAAIARGPSLENMDINSRKQLLGFALSHCDEESVGELLHAWKDLDMQGQCETLMMLTGISSPTFSIQGTSVISLPGYSTQDIVDLKNCSELAEGTNTDDQEAHLNNIKNTLSIVARSLPIENGGSWDSVLKENGKILSFAALQLPWLIELTKKVEFQKKFSSTVIPGKQYVSVRTQAVITILSWLARNGFAPTDYLVASLAKSILEPPVTEEDDVMGCSFLLNIVDAFIGVDVIEEQLRTRKSYQEISSIMNIGMTYSMLHNSGLECAGPAERRDLLLRKFKEKHKLTNSDEINKIDKVQSSFWREWKLKLEVKKHIADQSRVLEQIMPGVETARFLSGDINYIRSTVFSLIDSLKFEKKQILKDLLELSHTYGLSQAEVMLRYLTSVLTSDVWTNNDIMAEFSDIKEGILSYAPEAIKTLSLVVYPVINGCKKQRLAIIFGLLSDCYSQLVETKQPLPIVYPDLAPPVSIELPQFYELIQQECERISFIESLNFKNIAGLSGVNLQCFNGEVYSHVDEVNLDALSKMVRNMSTIFKGSMPEGLISWQDVYKYFLQNLLKTLENRARNMFEAENSENFLDFIAQLEQIYDFCRIYIKLLEPSDSFDIMKQYFTVILPLHVTSSIPDTSTWQDCLVSLLHFWIRLSEEMQEFASSATLFESTRFYPECLMSCLKVLMKLVMEDSISPSQCWGSIVGYLKHGLTGDSAIELFIFCKAMIFSGCGFQAVSEVFLDSVVQCPLPLDLDYQDLPHLYLKALESILQDLEGGALEYEKLYQLVSSLGHLEGDLEELKRVRCIVWERIVRFSENLQLPSHVRVHALELMQFISGKSIRSFTSELPQNVLSWEGWDEELFGIKKTEAANSDRLLDPAQSSSRFTNTLVALKSSQLASSISPSIGITPDDLSDVDAAASCFLRLTEVATGTPHFKVLLAILEEWEGLFVVRKEELATAEATNAEHNWSVDDWDEGWESFQELEVVEKKKDIAGAFHPLHICWAELLTKLAISQSGDVLRLIDESVSKSGVVLLDEGDARRLSLTIIGDNYLMGLKITLILPYESLQLESLGMMEEKLKQEGISDAMGGDHEFLLLVLSSGVMSNIISESSYGTIFSYICYLVGNLSRKFQEVQLSKQARRKKDEHEGDTEAMLFLFTRILFPAFVSELVKADQPILAGFLITKFMHTNPLLSLINVADASLHRYLERQLYTLSSDSGETSTKEILPNTVSKLKGRLRNLLESALSLLPRNDSR